MIKHYYPEKSEIVIGTIGQKFFDVIKPLEKNKKPEEKISQNHLKDQPLEAPNTTTGPQVTSLDQNETKVYKLPPDSLIPSEQQETLTDPDLTERVIEDVKSPLSSSIFHKELDQTDVKESTVDNQKEEINKTIVEGSKKDDVSSREDDTETTDKYETTPTSSFQNGGTENKDGKSDVQQGSILRKRHPLSLTKGGQTLQLDNRERPGAIRSNSNDEYTEGSISSSPFCSVTPAEENINKRPLRTSTHE